MRPVKKTKEQHGKQAHIIASLIERKINAKFAALDASVSRLTKELRVVRPERIRKLEAEVNAIKDLLEDFNVKNLEEDIFKEFREVNARIDSAVRRRRLEPTSPPPAPEPASKKEESLQREIEALKTKTEWLEMEFEKADPKLLLERIKLIERRLDNVRVENPMIIE